MRWLKRIGIFLGVLLALTLLMAMVVAYRTSRVPQWYVAARSVPAEATTQTKNKLIYIQNWAGKNSVANLAARDQDGARYTTEQFSADDINTLISKWTSDAGIKEKVGAHVQDIRVHIEDDRIIIAGFSVEYGKVISIAIRPGKSADGYATLTLDAIRVGEMALPKSMVGAQQKQVSTSLAALTSKQRGRLAIDGRGVASSETINVYYSTLLADLLSGKSPDAYTFVSNELVIHSNHAVVTRVQDFKLQSGKLQVTLEMLTPEQRSALLDQLRARTAP
jgi:uncharacterized protein YpmS